MNSLKFLTGVLVVCGFLSACEPAPEESQSPSSNASIPSETPALNDEPDENSDFDEGRDFDEVRDLEGADNNNSLNADGMVSHETSDEVCGSLKPLLLLLPSEKSVAGLAETYRGCESSSEQAVKVIYSQEGENYTELSFSVSVLEGTSPYATSYISVEGASEDQKDFFRKGVSAVGDMYKIRVDTCRNYAKNPIIPDGRNPVVFTLQGIEVCVMDNLDANKEVWNAFGVYKNLGVQLEFQGVKAGEIVTASAAKEYLEPLFALFKFDADID